MILSWIPKTVRTALKSLLGFVLFSRASRAIPNFNSDDLGINLLGYSQGDLGLGQALRYLALALARTKITFLVRHLKVPTPSKQTNIELNYLSENFCRYPINCIVLNPDVFYRLPSLISYSEWAKRYNIAYWFWELENFPTQWKYALPIIDEIWVNTEFNEKTMRTVHSCVTKIPFAIEFELPSAHFNRGFFGLPEDRFIFLTSFDFHSSIERKNPQASIAAFLEAFPDPNCAVTLIIKSTNGQNHPEQYQSLRKLSQHDSRIIFLDCQLSSSENRGLLNTADCFVSLHRSEGLGLGLAESMYLGKPVIATNYSGNLEFMNPKNACLVSYKLIPVGSHYPHGQNQVWAQADISDAARYMFEIFNNPPWRRVLGVQARQDMLTNHSSEVMGNAIAKRMSEIAQE
jgi:glycosyltransferase involved in cell wall biosynthesis